MFDDCYQIAFERANNEIFEINALIQRLHRRKVLLENLLEPLKLLAPRAHSGAISATVSDGSSTEFPTTKTATQLPPVVALVDVLEPESGSFEAPTPLAQPESQEGDVNARIDGRSTSYADVAKLAYRYWNERGQLHGYHEEDWLRATRELQNSAY